MGMKIQVQFENLGAVLSRLEGVGNDIARATGKALFTEAEQVMTAAKGLTPVDTGALRASGYVEVPNLADDGVSVELGFGGPAKDYAEIVHENLNAHHDVGQAKFLEQPLNDAQSRIQRSLDEAVREAVANAGFEI